MLTETTLAPGNYAAPGQEGVPILSHSLHFHVAPSLVSNAGQELENPAV